MKFPLSNFSFDIPISPHPGSFGVTRKHDVHTGVDLYCQAGSEVFAIESGVVEKVINFTGPEAGSPWWNKTSAIIIKGSLGWVLYGEVSTSLIEGDMVQEGDVIGNVETVLKKDKGTPMSMLHIELYNQLALDGVIWHLGEEKPRSLLNPTDLLLSIKTNET